MSRRDEDRELQTTLRAVTAMVLLALLIVLVVVAVFSPLLTERVLDTTLVLGLAASILGALPVYLGVSYALWRKNGGGKDGE